MLHPLPLPLSSCLGCIPPLIGLPSLRFYAVGSSLFLLFVCFCLCSLFYRDDVLCWLLLARPFLYAFHAHLRFPVDLVWFRLSCDHGWIRSGSVNVRKQQQQQQQQQPFYGLDVCPGWYLRPLLCSPNVKLLMQHHLLQDSQAFPLARVYQHTSINSCIVCCERRHPTHMYGAPIVQVYRACEMWYCPPLISEIFRMSDGGQSLDYFLYRT